jgi:very-short-patch-repair endonuclease
VTDRDFDDRVAAIAARQAGAFTRSQVLEVGGTDRMIRRRRDARRWTSRIQGVYELTQFPESWLRDLWVACLAPSTGAVVSFQAAAVLHGLATFRTSPVVVTVPHSDTRLTALGTVHQSRRLYEEHVTALDGLPVTTVARTIMDLSAIYRISRVELAMDSALAARTCTVDDITTTFDDLASRGRRGIATIRRLLATRQPGYVAPSTMAEALLLRALRHGGLARPALQFPHPGSEIEGFVDAAYPAERLLLEVDGRRWHTRERDFARDRARDIAATIAGYRTLRFTWDDVSTRASWVADQVRAALARAA